ncbi:hypothetical protein E2C01_060384 [Portunus trituberculatus]|uniref:Uncharacterized protein n=1 Tax=Portunus trituberculatus TaxID=210409 RepID=A0A5B7H8K0_PORTR|nr:hypothetical protein [Portunus trituberculatus]
MKSSMMLRSEESQRGQNFVCSRCMQEEEGGGGGGGDDEDVRILRYMTRVRQQNGRSSSEVADMCGVKDISVEQRCRNNRNTKNHASEIKKP